MENFKTLTYFKKKFYNYLDKNSLNIIKLKTLQKKLFLKVVKLRKDCEKDEKEINLRKY